MLRRTVSMMATVMVVVALMPGAAVAEETPDAPVYLSLGTSLAAGSMADADGNTTIKSSNRSYTNQLFRRIKGNLEPNLTHVKLGCDGETADTFVGGVNLYGEHSACWDDYSTGSQMGDALETLQTRKVALVTIDLGSNDILQAQQACLGDPVCIVGEIEVIATKVATIVGTLRVAGGYSGPIVGMTYYNPQVAIAIGFYPGNPGPLAPNLPFAQSTDQLAQGFNGALAAAYEAAGAEVADVYRAFNSGDFGDDAPLNGVPDNVDRVCALTAMCPDGEGVNANIHPKKRGYKVIAKTFFRIVKRLNNAG